jgi:hypothetical protein
VRSAAFLRPSIVGKQVARSSPTAPTIKQPRRAGRYWLGENVALTGHKEEVALHQLLNASLSQYGGELRLALVDQTLANAFASDLVEPRLAVRPVDVRQLQNGDGVFEVLVEKSFKSFLPGGVQPGLRKAM